MPFRPAYLDIRPGSLWCHNVCIDLLQGFLVEQAITTQSVNHRIVDSLTVAIHKDCIASITFFR